MSERLTDLELRRRLSELPREIVPRRDAWPDISARIGNGGAGREAPESSRVWMWRAAAASLVIAVAAGLLLTPGRDAQHGTGAPTPVTAAVSGAERPAAMPVSTLAGLVAASDVEYLTAFREFLSAGDYSRESLSPQAIATIEKGWADLRSAETALSAALEKNPDNRFLNDRMLELRGRQLDFLQQLALLDLTNRRLTS